MDQKKKKKSDCTFFFLTFKKSLLAAGVWALADKMCGLVSCLCILA